MTKKKTVSNEELDDILGDEDIIEDEPIENKEEEILDEKKSEKSLLRIFIEAYYSFQKSRVQANNQIRDIIRKKLEGIGFDQVEEKKDEKDKKVKYTDREIITMWNNAVSTGKINNDENEYMQSCLYIAKNLKTQENEYKEIMKKFLNKQEIYIQYLGKIRGVAELSSANLMRYLGDCSKFDNISKLWAYCGYSVVEGKAPKRKKGETINFNAKLRSILWNISNNLMKLNHGYYRTLYNTEKEKHLNRVYPTGELKGKYGAVYKEEDIHISKLHAHNRALRKIIKHFLSHYWESSREIAGLPIEKHYVEAVLGHEHIISWKKALSLEGTYIKPTKEDELETKDTDN
jgi:hypothetical protein